MPQEVVPEKGPNYRGIEALDEETLSKKCMCNKNK
jgi:hypothetical protein